VATVGMISISVIALFVTSGTPLVPSLITGTIVILINTYILSEIIDSDLDIYLKKSFLYKTNRVYREKL
jgi:hypothetical protein